MPSPPATLTRTTPRRCATTRCAASRFWRASRRDAGARRTISRGRLFSWPRRRRRMSTARSSLWTEAGWGAEAEEFVSSSRSEERAIEPLVVVGGVWINEQEWHRRRVRREDGHPVHEVG